MTRSCVVAPFFVPHGLGVCFHREIMLRASEINLFPHHCHLQLLRSSWKSSLQNLLKENVPPNNLKEHLSIYTADALVIGGRRLSLES